MIITRNGTSIELTEDELYAAYKEQERSFDYEDVEAELNRIISERTTDEAEADAAKRILASQKLLSACAAAYRQNIYDEMGWYDARRKAINEAICEEIKRMGGV